jgi:hypothetical protein
MSILHEIDRKKFIIRQPVYKGSGFPYGKPLNNRYIFLPKEGGFLNLSSLVNAGKGAVEFYNNNKDVIKSTVDNVTGAVKGIAEAVKTSKELEKIKETRRLKGKKKAPETSQMTIEQEEKLKKIGSGFYKF